MEEKINYYWAEFDEKIPLATKQDNDNSSLKAGEVNYQISAKMNLHKLIPLSHQATLAEAYLVLIESRCGGVYIYQKDKNDMIGLVTFEQIRQYLITGKLIEGHLH